MVGDGSIARVGTGFTTTWLGDEATGAAESTATFAVTAATPKTAGGYFEVSRMVLLQASAAAAQLPVRELARQVQHAVNVAFRDGDGASGQPLGVMRAPIGEQSGTSLAWAGIIEMMRLVEATGPFAASRAAFVMDPATAKLLRTREVAAGAGLILAGGMIGGYRAIVTTAMPASSLLFGDWSQAVECTWGVLEVGADPYAADNGAGFRKGIVGVRCFQTTDAAVLRPGSFAKSESIT
jgi:HK97 family phage major capsid protein